jgi:tRNA (cmo5U34)-methyltransferase
MSSKFDFDNVADFDKHIEMSIPNYSFLAAQVKEYIECFAQAGTEVIDLGCSTGKLLQSVQKLPEVTYRGIDNSTLCPTSEVNWVKFTRGDARRFTDITNGKRSSVITSIFFLQFLSRIDRRHLIAKIKDNLVVGGCFICCEKTHFDNHRLENITNTMQMVNKTKNFSADEILTKQKQLSRSMWLSTESELMNEMSEIGQPSIFWKSFGFTGIIVFKE